MSLTFVIHLTNVILESADSRSGGM